MKSAELGLFSLPLARRYAWHDIQIRLFENLEERHDGKAPNMRRAGIIKFSDTIRTHGYRKENAVAELPEAALVARYYGLNLDRLANTADPKQNFAP